MQVLAHDYTNTYVYEHVSNTLPWYYLLSCVWGGLEGSHLLWTFWLVFWLSILWRQSRKFNFKFQEAIWQNSFFLLLPMSFILAWTCNPFVLNYLGKTDGVGLNSLLQNPYMVIHPPLLFSSYSLLGVLWVASMSGVQKQQLRNPMFQALIQKFSLLTLAGLTTAIMLGGKWAYAELGWGGYWAWDPVENCSLMPWLLVVIGSHLWKVWTTDGRYPLLSLFALNTAFISAFFGTFLTRSGLVSSVHSFAQSDISTAYATWIIVLLAWTVCFYLFVALKQRILLAVHNAYKYHWLAASQLVFAFLFLLTLIGTMLPYIMTKYFATQVTVQGPFFNAYMPWVGFILLLFMALNYKYLLNNKLVLLFSACIGILIASFLIPWHLCIVYILWLLCLILAVHFIIYIYISLWQKKWKQMVVLLLHYAFLLLLVGLCANPFGSKTTFYLGYKQTMVWQDRSFTNQGFFFNKTDNLQQVGANITIKHGAISDTVPTSRILYANQSEMVSNVGIDLDGIHNIYLVLERFFPTNQSVILQVFYNPCIELVWYSILCMSACCLLLLVV
jgi:cytochrome c-type biogenesis protein CcmF